MSDPTISTLKEQVERVQIEILTEHQQVKNLIIQMKFALSNLDKSIEQTHSNNIERIVQIANTLRLVASTPVATEPKPEESKPEAPDNKETNPA